jgi:hypothetical protein
MARSSGNCWTLRDYAGRVLIGGTIGLILLLVGNFIAQIIVDAAGAGHKSSPWWDYAIWSASYGLPAVFIVGALLALACCRSLVVRLTLLDFASCCLLAAFISAIHQPAIARLESDKTPLDQLMPQMAAALFGCLAILCFAQLIGYNLIRLTLRRKKSERVLSPLHDRGTAGGDAGGSGQRVQDGSATGVDVGKIQFPENALKCVIDRLTRKLENKCLFELCSNC